MSDIGVAHLVRARNGIEPFRNFLESYAQHRSSLGHDLLIIYKGFTGPASVEKFRELLKPFKHRDFFIRDLGFDLRSYALAARHFDYPHLCFLNSYSVIQDSQWLEKLSAPLAQPGVGLVGATGSYESMFSNLTFGVPPGAGFSLPSLRREVNRFFFHPFPNPHIRTNAFLLSRRLMLEIWPSWIFTKANAYLLENGKNNAAQRVWRRKLKVLIVGKDGRAYEKEDWWRSNTYRQSNQENLLVADNQTRNYAAADFATRKYLSSLAWGDNANPAQP